MRPFYLTLSLLWSCSILTGCAGEPIVYEKAGAQPGDFDNAKYDCQVQMDQSSGAIAYRQDPLAHLNYLSQARGDMARCLKRYGWIARPAMSETK